jgi:deoxyribodipyrimidine photo-lyase
MRSGGRFVLYWMHRAQRAAHNPALQHAVNLARQCEASVLAVIALPRKLPDRYARHYAFMHEGLESARDRLADKKIKLVAQRGDPVDLVSDLAGKAYAVVADGGYLRRERAWRKSVAGRIDCPFDWVETETVVPVETVSNKREYAARTIRKKINERRDEFIVAQRDRWPDKSSLPLRVKGDIDLSSAERALDALSPAKKPGAVKRFRGGTDEARRHLSTFIRQHLAGYAEARSDPSAPRVSLLSPYLNYGQISPIEIAGRVQKASGPSGDDKEAFLEELIVRRELAFNYAWFEPDYDSFGALPDWARETLDKHANDSRETTYSRQQLESASTDDPYWNAAMNEMLATGYMHNYMRMYWGKKILEWCDSPKKAFEIALDLNNKYFLDGRCENSYTNVAWIFGLHDRAWAERDVFGKIRYMSAGGLERKFDIDAYVEWADAL